MEKYAKTASVYHDIICEKLAYFSSIITYAERYMFVFAYS